MKTAFIGFWPALVIGWAFAPDIGIAFVAAIVVSILNAAAWHGAMLFFGKLKCPHCGSHNLEVTSDAGSCTNCHTIFRRNHL